MSKLTKTKLKTLFDKGLSHQEIADVLQKEKVTTKTGAVMTRENVSYYCLSWGMRKHKQKNRRVTRKTVGADASVLIETAKKLLDIDVLPSREKALAAIKILEGVQ